MCITSIHSQQAVASVFCLICEWTFSDAPLAILKLKYILLVRSFVEKVLVVIKLSMGLSYVAGFRWEAWKAEKYTFHVLLC